MRSRLHPSLHSIGLLLFGALIFTSPARAGTRPQATSLSPDDPTDRACATPDATPAEMDAVRAQVAKWLGRNRALAVGGQIKVAWHVISSGAEGDVPQSQIDAQIDELNKAYSGSYGGVNTGYTFVLASVDRTDNKRWFTMTPGTGKEKQAKDALAVDPAHRLNIYSCKPGKRLLGWACFPWSAEESNSIHGVVIHYGSVPGGYLTPYNLGGTADHEVGHYLGLFHTFQGGCTPPGDEVADTPDEATPTARCPVGKDTCPSPGLDPIQNYMDYSDDACYTEFTAGQDARMDEIAPVYRPSLLGAALAAVPSDVNPVTRGGDGTGETYALRTLPKAAEFRGPFPNPFADETALRLYLPTSQRVTVAVYNVAGQRVRTLWDGELQAGEQTIAFHTDGLPSGTYFARVRVAGGMVMNRTLVLMR